MEFISLASQLDKREINTQKVAGVQCYLEKQYFFAKFSKKFFLVCVVNNLAFIGL